MKSKLIILCIVTLATLIRFFPVLLYGLVLDEYDPFFNYKVTRYMIEKGLLAFTKWHDDTVWYPKGRDILATTYPGMMLYAYILHKFLSMFITLDVYNTCVIFPIIGGLFTLYCVYKFSRFISNKQSAMITLFLLALIPGVFQRSSAGFFDYECISIGLINLCFYYYLKYLKSNNLGDAIKFIFVYFNLGMCWGGYVFVMNFIALHSIALLFAYNNQNLMSKHFPNLSCKYYNKKNFPILFIIGNGLLYSIPVIEKKCFFSQEQIIPIVSLLIHALTFKKIRLPSLLILPIAYYYSDSAFTSGKLLNLFVKQQSGALVESISEHLPRSFIKYFLDCNVVCFIVPMSFNSILELDIFNSSFMFIYTCVSVFISAKILRCILISAPCFCICSGLYLSKLYDNIKENTFKRRLFVGASFIFSSYYALHCFKLAYYSYSLPQLLLYSEKSGVINDFHNSYKFLSRHEGVILNWWDYGYHINAYSKMKTLNDNNTNDWQRIKEVAQIYLSTEKEAFRRCKENNIDYVFIVSGIDSGYDQDMIAKAGWIYRIAMEDCDFEIDPEDSLLHKLCYYGNAELFDYARNVEYEKVGLKYFDLVYRSENNIVKIYQLAY